MPSGSHCEECIRLSDLYLDLVSYHASLMEGQPDTNPLRIELEWKMVQAENEVLEARERFRAHRAAHSFEREGAGSPASETEYLSRPRVVRTRHAGAIAELNPYAARLQVIADIVATFRTKLGGTLAWRQCISVLLSFLTTIGVLYALPSVLEMLLIHRHVSPWICCVAVGDLAGCLFLFTLGFRVTAIGLYVMAGSLESLVLASKLLRPESLVWIVDLVPATVAAALVAWLLIERPLVGRTR